MAILGAALIAITLSCISVESNGINIGGQNKEISLMTKTFDASSIKSIKAITSGGNISIDGDAAGQATIEVLGRGNNGKNYTKEEILEILKSDYEFSVGKDGNTLKAIARRNKRVNWKKAVSVSYIIHVSNNVATDLKTSGGNIRLNALKGEQHFATSGGNIKFSQLAGQMDGQTSGGNIEATDSHGSIHARTSGGNIKMQNLDGTVEMHTSGGNIKAVNVTGHLNVSTSGGNISLSEISASLVARTSGGSVEAAFNTFKNQAKLSTSGGSIRLDVPNAAKMNFDIHGSSVSVGQANHLQVEINKAKNHATGQINGGGDLLTAHTSGGSVKINFN